MSERVYLDWNATAPLRPEARDAMGAAMDVVGNPSSVHGEGRAAKAVVERARAQVADLAGCEPSEVVFTSGATEAASTVAAGFAGMSAPLTEHDCVLAHATDTQWDVSQDGRADVPPLTRTDGSRDLIALSVANSETGVLQDAPLTDASVALMRDAVQAWGKVKHELDGDFTLVSAHKFGGPKGVGAIILRPGVEMPALLSGGDQEMGRRSGTENVIGIAGFGAAAEAAKRDLHAGIWEHVAEMRDILEATLAQAAPDTIFVGREVDRLPNTSCIVTPSWRGETQVMAMDLAGYGISAGSACSSGKVKPSRVLQAMGFDETEAASAIRVSLGPATTKDDIAGFARTWIEAHKRWKARAA